MAIKQIVLSSIEDLKNKYLGYLKYLALPFITLVLYELFIDPIIIDASGIELAPATKDKPAVTLAISAFLSGLLDFSIYTYFSLNLAFITHKITLNKQSEISLIDGLIWHRKHHSFIKAFFILGLISILVAIPALLIILLFMFFNGGFDLDTNGFSILLGLFIAFLPSMYLFSRYSLIAPAAAANEPIKLSESFSLSRGYGWTIVLLTLILPALFNLFFTEVPTVILTFIMNISTIISIILLTNCYKYIKQAKTNTTDIS